RHASLMAFQKSGAQGCGEQSGRRALPWLEHVPGYCVLGGEGTGSSPYTKLRGARSTPRKRLEIRYITAGFDGLCDRPRSGRPPEIHPRFSCRHEGALREEEPGVRALRRTRAASQYDVDE
ncbi:MAG TPA: hypothetical protein VFQ61_04700, partial [Polyangiaceae bacterium]|nr:hypothetical protein [Polyangiaceae bacterium]